MFALLVLDQISIHGPVVLDVADCTGVGGTEGAYVVEQVFPTTPRDDTAQVDADPLSHVEMEWKTMEGFLLAVGPSFGLGSFLAISPGNWEGDGLWPNSMSAPDITP